MTVFWTLDCYSDVSSTHQYLTQNFNRHAAVALLKFCNLGTKVWNVRKSQVGHYNWSLTSRDKAAQWLCMQCTVH